MITQIVSLPSYDWTVVVFYCQRGYNEAVICAALESAECPPSVMDSALRLMRDGEPNTGFVYTDNDSRTSLMALGPADSSREFQNTFDHEKGHVVSHIAEACGIDYLSEEYQYLAGDLSAELFEIAQPFLCSDFCS